MTAQELVANFIVESGAGVIDKVEMFESKGEGEKPIVHMICGPLRIRVISNDKEAWDEAERMAQQFFEYLNNLGHCWGGTERHYTPRTIPLHNVTIDGAAFTPGKAGVVSLKRVFDLSDPRTFSEILRTIKKWRGMMRKCARCKGDAVRYEWLDHELYCKECLEQLKAERVKKGLIVKSTCDGWITYNRIGGRECRK